MSRNKPASYRLPDMTRNQIAELSERLTMSQAQVVAVAIDRIYQQESSQSSRSNKGN